MARSHACNIEMVVVFACDRYGVRSPRFSAGRRILLGIHFLIVRAG